MDGTKISLYNDDCKTLSSPEMCPNKCLYYDVNDKEWKIDSKLKVECGKI